MRFCTAMRNNFKVAIDITGDQEIIKLLEGLPVLILTLNGPLDKAVKAATKCIQDRAKQLAPDSKKTGTREIQSAKSKAAWYGKLKNTIRTKLIRHERGCWAVVGPKSPDGNMAHFMQEKPRVHILWGKAKSIKQYRITRNWITQAFDETRSSQDSAIATVLKSEHDKLALSRNF